MVFCKECGKEVPQSSRKGGRKKEYCNESCRNKWRYKNDPVVYNRYTNNPYSTQKQRAYRNKWKALQSKGGKCIQCGESHPAKLCFHHREPSKKELELGSRTFANRKWETIKEEVDKCDLLCHNCHQMLHYGGSWDEFLGGSSNLANAPNS